MSLRIGFERVRRAGSRRPGGEGPVVVGENEGEGEVMVDMALTGAWWM